MDRNSYIGLGLIFVLLIGYFYINQPSKEELAVQKRYSDSLQLVQKAEQAKQQALELKAKQERDSLSALFKTDSNALKAVYGGFAGHVSGEERDVLIENKSLRINISSKGARIKQAELIGFKTDSRKALLLFDPNNSEHSFSFTVDKKRVNSADYYWHLQNRSSNSATFRLNYGNAGYIEQTYTLKDDYNLEHSFSSNGLSGILDASKDITLQLRNDVPLQERDITEETKKTTVYFKFPEEPADYISETKHETIKSEQDLEWVSLKQQFFNMTVISESGPFLKGSVVASRPAVSGKNVKNLSTGLLLPVQSGKDQNFKLRYYLGPNKYDELRAQKIGLDKIIPLGWGIFGWINRFMIIPVFNFLDNYLSNYGIIILLLTLIIKTILLPLVWKSYKSTAKMRLLKPEMDEIKEKYKDDMQTIQMENLKLYKKAGVNPLGGCLPMLLQMPILIAVFQFVPSAFEFRQQAFLWADDLSIYDSIWNFGKIPVIDYIYGDHVSLFTLLMTVSTLIYTRMNNQLTGGMNEQMKYISYLMPIMFLGFFNKYAAALTYYYFLSNVVTFTQQWAIRKFVDEDKLKAQIHESKNKKTDDKKSAFQKRLEELAKAKSAEQNLRKNKK